MKTNKYKNRESLGKVSEKELMWKLYQKCGSFKEVAKMVGRNPATVSRHVHEYEAAVSAAGYVMNAQNT